jgi:PAS domain S-box-containing protein
MAVPGDDPQSQAQKRCPGTGDADGLALEQLSGSRERSESTERQAALGGPDRSEIADLLDHAPVAALVRTLDGDVITYWNHGAEQLYGWTAAEALGQVSHRLLEPSTRTSRADLEDALRTSGQWSGELVHLRRDGQRVVVASQMAAHRDATGRVVSALELNRELSEHKGLESDLHESNERFRLLVEAVRDYAIFLLSPDGRVLTWNEGAQRLKGYLPADIIGQPFTRFYTPEDLQSALPQRLLVRAAAEGRAEHEGWRVRKDGTRFWADVVITALYDNTGHLRGFLKITRDLSERKEAEEARARASREEGVRVAAEAAAADIRASRDQLAAILAGVTDGITVLDRSGRMLYANDAAALLCGFADRDELLAAPREEILSRFELFDESGAHLSIEELPTRRALDGETPPASLLRFRVRATGEERWSVVNATPIKADDLSIAMAVTVFRDVTEQRRAEDTTRFLSALNLELTRTLNYRETLRRIAQLAVPTLADWCVVDVLSEEGELQRLAVAHVDASKVELAQTVQERYPPDPNATHGVHAVIRTGISRLLPVITDTQVEAAAHDADHLRMLRALRLHSAITVPMLARGRTLGAITLVAAESGRRYGPEDLALAEDLALRAALAVDNARLYREAQERAATQVELNRALQGAMSQLERELQTRDEFLASASHDLKNPIAGIKGNAQLLLRRLSRPGEIDLEGIRQSVERIVSVSTRAGQQVDELLDDAGIQMGRALVLERHPTDLVRLAADLVADYQQQTEDHKFQLNCGVPALVALVDERRLGRALGNLLDNAVKYSPEGGLIRVEVLRDPQTDSAVVSVHDPGVGIPEADLGRIFQRFERGSNVVRVIAGTGIGLASASHIVESHGGTIEVSSEPEQGSSFTIRLPIERSAKERP